VRGADEYEAAQERGEVRGANERTASNLEAVGTAEIGLSHKETHKARILRDAELIEPGIVRRTLDSSLEFSNMKLRPGHVGTAAPRARYLRLAHPVQG
jgi:hypothetical protein